MSKASRWLTLAVLGACGSVASAQSPLMMQPYPGSGFGLPGYGMPQAAPAYPPPGYFPQPAYQPMPRPMQPPMLQPIPQPRVLYVPATAGTWPGGTVPAQPVSLSAPRPAIPATTVAPVPPAAPAAPDPVASAPKVEVNPYLVDVPAKKTEKQSVKPTPAKTASSPNAATGADVAVPSPYLSASASACSGPGCTAHACVGHACGPVCGPVCAPPLCGHDDEHRNWLPRGHWDLQFMGGAFADVTNGRYSYAESALRIGKVWEGGHCCGCFPGAIETMLEINGGATYQSDFGDGFGGAGILVRYNLVTLGSRIVPYVQAGVGAQYNDAYQEHEQIYLGSRMNLTAQAGLGLRVFLTKCLSLDIEGDCQSICNLNMSHRNEGIVSLGGMAGLTYFLPCCGRR